MRTWLGHKLWLKTICSNKELVTTVVFYKQINSECPLGLKHMQNLPMVNVEEKESVNSVGQSKSHHMDK